MKKLLAILAICLLPGVAWGASYYGCGAGAINGDTTWCAVGDVTNGVCAKDSGDYVAGATALAGTHTLYANGCTITIPSGTFTAAKLSTKGDGSKGAGGGFTANANDITVTLDASIEGGTTDCLTASNTAGTASVINILTTNGGGTINTDATASADGVVIAGTKVTVNIGKTGFPVAVTGGGAANYAISDGSTVTTKTIYANITGGGVSSAAGYFAGGSSGTLNFYGNITAGSTTAAYGIYQNGNNAITVVGNCTAGSGGTTSHGCYSAAAAGTFIVDGNCVGGAGYGSGCLASAGTTITCNGNLIATATGAAFAGKFIWNPSSTAKFVKISGDGTPTFWYMTPSEPASPDPAVANVKVGTTYGWDGSAVFTGTLAAGGGAWAN